VTSVLLVDDDEQIRLYVERVLRNGGYRTVSAKDGIEAADVAMAEGPFDVLITDLVMPEVDGEELGRRLRQRQPDLPILYLTGFSDLLFAERCPLPDGEAFLDKPCTPTRLLELVEILVPSSAPTALPA
jgi:CheY-like chemotaxis protein